MRATTGERLQGQQSLRPRSVLRRLRSTRHPTARNTLKYKTFFMSQALRDGHGSDAQVQFQHFTGIAPSRFSDIFQKRERINKETQTIYEYYEGKCEPRIGGGEIDHIENEAYVLKENFSGEGDDE